MVWYTLYDRTPGTGDQGWNGNTLRQAVPVTAYNIGAPPNGTQVRVTFHAGPGLNCNINEAWIAHAGVNNISFDGTQVQLKSGSSNFFTVLAGGLLVSDSVNYAFDKTKPIVISSDMVNHPTNVGRGHDPLIGFYYQTSGTASTSTITGLEQTDPVTGEHFQIWPKVEVFFTDPSGAATCTLTKNLGQVDPTSGTTVKFFAQFNKGVAGFTAADVDLSSSTVTWQGGSPAVSVTGQDFAFIISVSGMLTIGNIVMRIPAGAVTAIADGVANTASNTVTVAWNPDLLGAGANVFEVTAVNRNTLRVEIRDPQTEFGYLDQSAFHSGPGTFDITNVANNGKGGVRITVAGTYIDYVNLAILDITASPVSDGLGGNRMRCTVYSTATVPAFAYLRHCIGILEANHEWTTAVIDSTHFDLVGSTFPVGKTYLGNGWIWISDEVYIKACIHQVTGVPGVNKAWPIARSGTNTYDLIDSEFTGAWTGGGKISAMSVAFERPNPSKGGALDWGNMVGSDGRTFRFQDVPIPPELFFNHDASMVVGNYSMTGGYTITKVFRKTKPYSGGQCDFKQTYQLPTVRFRHYIYLELGSNLVNGTYTILFPPATNLPPKTFTYNDKITRCSAIHVDQNGHRVNDGKLGYISQWIPDRLPYGDVDFSSVTAWHLINDAGTIVATFGAPVLRVGPTTNEGLSYENIPAGGPLSQGPILVQSRGPAIKVLNATFATNTTITVNDASLLSNGDMVVFVDMYHWAGAARQAQVAIDYPNPGPNSPAVPVGNLAVNHVGMWQLESDSGSSPLYHRVVNKVGNTFNLDCPRGVSAATIANGGSGYVVGHVIRLESLQEGIGPVLQVTSVGGGGAVTGVRVMPNEEWFWNLGYAIAPINTSPNVWQGQGSGKIDYPYTIPTNPRPQISATLHFVSGSGWIGGPGTGATFNLTWTRNPWDRTAYPARGLFPSGNPDTTVRSDPGNVFYGYPPQAFDHTTFNDLGNLCYKINESGNRAGTYVYGLDYSSFTSTGTYRIYIPNIGVSDPIYINENRTWRAAKQYIKALYHQRQGCTLDGRFGFTRPDGVKPGPSRPIYKSYMPYCFTNYALEPIGSYIFDVNKGQFVGGSYGIWLRGAETGTRLRMTGFGGHQDGGDWDVRINETCWGYYHILEVWQRLPAPAKASFYNMGTPTLLESGLDPTIFAGTNGLPSPIVEVIWGIEPQRSSQEAGGGVSGGTNYGEGVVWNETSNNNGMSWYTWYPDPVCTFNYAFVAAKLARVLYALGGYTTLGNHYRDSAIAAYNWADSIITNSTTRDAWFTPVKDRAFWSTGTYDANMTALVNYCQRERRTAAAGLYALTGTTAYRTTFDAGGTLGAVDVRSAFGHWEYASAPFAVDAGIRDNAIQLYKDMATTNYVGQSDAPDISYDSGMQRGSWNMAYGDNGTNWIINTPSLTFGAIAYDMEVPPNTTESNRCRRALHRLMGFRHGANQLGMCLCNGLGVRHNLESLNQDSRMLSQVLPIAGLTSEGWGNLFPAITGLTYGDSQISRIQHPQYDSDIVSNDPSVPYREQYPWAQLCWPRWELFLETYQAVEHSEYTTQQQLEPALATTMYLAGFDGNSASGALAPATVSLVSSSNPSALGAPVSFTCTVSGASGTPTGTVNFNSDGTNIGTVTLSGGVGQVTISTLTGGSHTISAVYPGNATYDPSSNSLVQDVLVVTAKTVNPRLKMRMRLHA